MDKFIDEIKLHRVQYRRNKLPFIWDIAKSIVPVFHPSSKNKINYSEEFLDQLIQLGLPLTFLKTRAPIFTRTFFYAEIMPEIPPVSKAMKNVLETRRKHSKLDFIVFFVNQVNFKCEQ